MALRRNATFSFIGFMLGFSFRTANWTVPLKNHQSHLTCYLCTNCPHYVLVTINWKMKEVSKFLDFNIPSLPWGHLWTRPTFNFILHLLKTQFTKPHIKCWITILLDKIQATANAARSKPVNNKHSSVFTFHLTTSERRRIHEGTPRQSKICTVWIQRKWEKSLKWQTGVIHSYNPQL